MADITVTAANVVAASGATTLTGTAGETVTAGQLLYRDSADNEYKLCDADNTAAIAAIAGIALNGASDGQPIEVLTAGNINPGATVVAGTVYVNSGTAGGIAPAADLLAGDFTSIVGIATTTSNILVQIQNGGVVIA